MEYQDLLMRAEAATSREEALKILKKARKQELLQDREYQTLKKACKK